MQVHWIQAQFIRISSTFSVQTKDKLSRLSYRWKDEINMIKRYGDMYVIQQKVHILVSLNKSGD